MAVRVFPVLELSECLKRPVRAGVPIYRASSLDGHDLRRVVADHVADMPVHECCPLFGGLLMASDAATLFPQCCATLGEHHMWAQLPTGRAVLYSGHPGAVIEIIGDRAVFACEDDGTGWSPSVPARFEVDRGQLLDALQRALLDVQELARRIDAVGRDLGLDDAGRWLVLEPDG